MKPLTIIQRVEGLGVTLTAAKDSISFKGTKRVLTSDLKAMLVANKTALLKALPKHVPSSQPHTLTTPIPPSTIYQVISSGEQLNTAIQTITRAEQIALATGTTGLNPLQDQLQLLYIALPSGQVFLVDVPSVGSLTPLADILNEKKIIAHDALLVLKFLWKCCQLASPIIHCTMIAARLLDGGVHLKDDDYCTFANVSRRYLGSPSSQDILPVSATGPPTQVQLEQAAHNVKQLFRLHSTLQTEIAKAELSTAFDLDCKLIPVLARMFAIGVGVNKTGWHALLSSRKAEMLRLQNNLSAKFPGVDLDSHPQIKKALQDLGLDIAATNAEALAPYIDRPYISDLLDYRSVASFVRNHGQTIADLLDTQSDNRIRAYMNPIAAATGRFSSSEPNLQGLPKSSAVRQCIEAAPGYFLVCADYSAIELRVIAHYTQDSRLLQIFRNNGDPHRTTSALVLDKPESEITPAERQSAKAVNFGFAFGMQPPKFVVYARTSYGVVMTLEEATRFRNGYFQAYPGVAQWHERVRRERPSVVRTASGRWWRVGSSWGALCKRLNGPIQGTAADGIKLAMRLLDERLPTYGARMILSIHDEILVEAPENTAEQVKLVMELTMIEAMQEFVPTVPIVVEIKVRRTWSEEDAVRK